MIGEVLKFRREFGTAVAFPLAIATALTALGALLPSPVACACAVMALCIAAVGLLVPQAAFRWRVDPDALADECSSARIPYATIRSVYPCFPTTYLARPAHYALEVAHDGGYLQIPASRQIPAARLEDFLLQKLPEAARATDPDIEQYRQTHIESFGAERVFSYAGRRPQAGVRRPRLIWAFATLLISGMLVSATGVVWKLDSVAAIGAQSAFAGLIALAIYFGVSIAQSRERSKVSCLVISPIGIALSHQGLKGELKWNEVRDIQYGGDATRFALTKSRLRTVLQLQLSGAALQIVDSFDHPLTWIHQRINQYWR